MIETTLRYLSCPACNSHQVLSVSDSILPTVEKSLQDSSSTIWEGTLACRSCGASFPIIHGLPILVHRYDDYIARRKQEIVGVIAQHGASERCRDLVFDIPESIYGANARQESWESRQGIDVYVHHHYAQSPADNPHSEIVSDGLSFYDRISRELLSTVQLPTGLLLDVGCNVGGFIYRLAPSVDFAIGVDQSFAAAVLARDILCAEGPEALPYKRYNESFRAETLILQNKRLKNVAIVVADAKSLPLLSARVDYALLANVLDVSDEPRLILKEIRRTVPTGGFIATISPYYWRPDRSPPSSWLTAPDRDSASSMRLLLAEMHLVPQLERDRIPWVLRFYDRYFQIWMCHLLVSQVAAQPEHANAL